MYLCISISEVMRNGNEEKKSARERDINVDHNAKANTCCCVFAIDSEGEQ